MTTSQVSGRCRINQFKSQNTTLASVRTVSGRCRINQFKSIWVTRLRCAYVSGRCRINQFKSPRAGFQLPSGVSGRCRTNQFKSQKVIVKSISSRAGNSSSSRNWCSQVDVESISWIPSSSDTKLKLNLSKSASSFWQNKVFYYLLCESSPDIYKAESFSGQPKSRCLKQYRSNHTLSSGDISIKN
mgnify:CR=1 FL=1